MLVLLLGAAALALLPFGAGSVRVGRLSVVWWYAASVAPIIAVVVTIAVSLRQRTRPDAVGSPVSPE